MWTTILTVLIPGVATLIIGLSLYRSALLHRYVTDYSGLCRGIATYLEADTDIAGLSREVYGIYRGMTADLEQFGYDRLLAALGSSPSADRGQVVGIVLAKNKTAGVEGMGYVLPANDVLRVARELLQDGLVAAMPDLGAQVRDLTVSQAERAGVLSGALVDSVTVNSAADRAGLRAGDVVTALNGRPVADRADLLANVKALRAGDSVTLTLRRSGGSLTVTFTLTAAE